MIECKNIYIMMTFSDNAMVRSKSSVEEYYHNLARDILLKNPENVPQYIKFSSIIEIPNLKHIFIGLNITKIGSCDGKYKSICVLTYS